MVLGPLLRVSRVYDSMSDTGDRDARVRLEEFLAEASADDLRSLLRHLGDSGGDDERVLHVVMQLLVSSAACQGGLSSMRSLIESDKMVWSLATTHCAFTL